jgi:hypothetical protein
VEPLVRYVRISCLLCLATIAGAAHAGERGVSSSSNPPGRVIAAVHERRRESDERWSETAQMVLLGVGLSYVGLRFGHRKA